MEKSLSIPFIPLISDGQSMVSKRGGTLHSSCCFVLSHAASTGADAVDKEWDQTQDSSSFLSFLFIEFTSTSSTFLRLPGTEEETFLRPLLGSRWPLCEKWRCSKSNKEYIFFIPLIHTAKCCAETTWLSLNFTTLVYLVEKWNVIRT